MPRVPQTNLNPNGLPGFTAPNVVPFRSAQGQQIANFGQALEGVGLGGLDIARQMQEDVDNGRATQRYNIWETENQKDLAEYLNATGENALGDNRQRILDRIEKRAEELSGGLENEVQKGMFRQQVARRMPAITGRVVSHEADQARTFRAAESATMADTALGTAVAAMVEGPVPDLVDFERARNTLVDQVRVAADVMGMGPKETEAMVLERTTKMHLDIIGRLVDKGRVEEARKYLAGEIPGVSEKALRQEVSPQGRGKMEAAVREAKLSDDASKMALDIIDRLDRSSGGIDIVTGGRALLQADLRDNKISAEMADAVWTRIREEATFRAETIAGQVNQAMIQAEVWLSADENRDKGADQLPANLKATLKAGGKWAAIVQFSNNGRHATDPMVWEDVMRFTPKEFATLPEQIFMDKVRGNLSPAQFDEAWALWRKARDQATTEDDSLLSLAQQIHMRSVAPKWLQITETGQFEEDEPGGWAAVFLIKQAVQDAINQHTIDEKSPPNAKEKEAILDKVFTDRAFTTVGTNRAVPIIGISGPPAPESIVEDAVRFVIGGQGDIFRIPVPVFLEIRRQLAAANDPTTDAEVLKLWFANKQPKTVQELNKDGGR
jgi:hypothetical protein